MWNSKQSYDSLAWQFCTIGRVGEGAMSRPPVKEVYCTGNESDGGTALYLIDMQLVFRLFTNCVLGRRTSLKERKTPVRFHNTSSDGEHHSGALRACDAVAMDPITVLSTISTCLTVLKVTISGVQSIWVRKPNYRSCAFVSCYWGQYSS
jgi:hypothetical protein